MNVHHSHKKAMIISLSNKNRAEVVKCSKLQSQLSEGTGRQVICKLEANLVYVMSSNQPGLYTETSTQEKEGE